MPLDYIKYTEIYPSDLEKLGFIKISDFNSEAGGSTYEHPEGWVVWFHEKCCYFDGNDLKGYTRPFWIRNKHWPADRPMFTWSRSLHSVQDIKDWLSGDKLPPKMVFAEMVKIKYSSFEEVEADKLLRKDWILGGCMGWDNNWEGHWYR